MVPDATDGLVLLEPHVPRCVATTVAAGRTRQLHDNVVACFVDLARFTAISEALGREGTQGTERLVQLVNDLFAPCIDAAIDRGGDVVAFAGDAVTTIFTSPDAAVAAQDWAEEVLDIVAALAPVETEHVTYEPAAKVGIASGSVTVEIVGSDDMLRPVIAGPAVDRAAAAEASIGPGEIANRITNAVIEVSPGSAGRSRPDARQLAPFVPSVVLDRITIGGPELLDEHRPATVLFVGFAAPEIDERTRRDLEEAMRIVADHHGTVVSLGAGDKGTTLLAVFGAPSARANQHAEAVLAANRIESVLDVGIGVATGLCFSGRVGSERRWSYNVLGDLINTSARLMGATAEPGGVLADGATIAATGEHFEWGEPENLTLKGKAEPVVTARLLGPAARDVAASDLPLHGRVHEVERIGEALGSVRDGAAGRVVFVTGDSGVGKSRLGREATDIARSLGVAVSFADLWHRNTGRSYGPWRRVVFDALGLGAEPGAGEFMEAAARRAPELVGTADVRNLLFEPHGAAAITSGLDNRAAAEVREEALLALITAANEPTILVVDDAHDLDEASRRLLDKLARRVSNLPMVLVVIARDAEVALERVDTHLPLGPVADTDARAIVADHAAKHDVELSSDDIEAIVARVGGIPQLLRLFAAIPTSGAGDGVTPDARSVVLERFDRLGPDERQALSMAAVLGRHFAAPDFVGAFAGEVEARRLLRQLVEHGLLERAGATLSFASPILPDVAYAAAAHARRAELHRSVGLHIERLPRRATARAEELAHHFGFTNDVDRHRRYFEPAAIQAGAAYANTAAIAWYERALDVAEPADLATRSRLELGRGSILEHTGSWDAARHAYEAVREDIPALRARALASLARLQLEHEGYDVAMANLTEARHLASDLDDAETLEWVLERMALSATSAGRHEDALAHARDQVEIASRLADTARQGAALSNLGTAHSMLGDQASARRELADALQTLLDAGALAIACDVEMELAMAAYDDGDPDTALARLEQAAERAEKIGYRRSVAAISGNRGLVLIELGRMAEAQAEAGQACSALLEIGDLNAATAALGMLAMARLEIGDPAGAAAALARVLHAGRRTGTVSFRDRAYEVLTEAYEALGDEVRRDACIDQRRRIEHDVTDQELAEVAALSPPGDLGLDFELEALLIDTDTAIGRAPAPP